MKRVFAGSKLGTLEGTTIRWDMGGTNEVADVDISLLMDQGCALLADGSCMGTTNQNADVTLYGFAVLESTDPRAFKAIKDNATRLFSGAHIMQPGPPSVSEEINDKIMELIGPGKTADMMKETSARKQVVGDQVKKFASKPFPVGYLKLHISHRLADRKVPVVRGFTPKNVGFRVVASKVRVGGHVPLGTMGTQRDKGIVVWDNAILEKVTDNKEEIENVSANFTVNGQPEPATLSIPTSVARDTDPPFSEVVFTSLKPAGPPSAAINLDNRSWQVVANKAPQIIMKNVWGLDSPHEANNYHDYAFNSRGGRLDQDPLPDEIIKKGIHDHSKTKFTVDPLRATQKLDGGINPRTSEIFDDVADDVRAKLGDEFQVYKGLVPAETGNFESVKAYLAGLGTVGAGGYLSAAGTYIGAKATALGAATVAKAAALKAAAGTYAAGASLPALPAMPAMSAAALSAGTVAGLTAGGAAVGLGVLHRKRIKKFLDPYASSLKSGTKLIFGDAVNAVGGLVQNAGKWVKEALTKRVKLPLKNVIETIALSEGDVSNICPDKIDPNIPGSYRFLNRDCAESFGLEYADPTPLSGTDDSGAFYPDAGDTLRSDGIYRGDVKLSKSAIKEGLLELVIKNAVSSVLALRPATLAWAALATLPHPEIVAVTSNGDTFSKVPPIAEWVHSKNPDIMTAVKKSALVSAKELGEVSTMGKEFRMLEGVDPPAWPLTVPLPEHVGDMVTLRNIALANIDNIWGVHSSGVLFINHPSLKPVMPPPGTGVMFVRGITTKLEEGVAQALVVPKGLSEFVFFPGVVLENLGEPTGVPIVPPFEAAGREFALNSKVVGFTTSGNVLTRLPFYSDWKLDPSACAQSGIFIKRTTPILQHSASKVTPLCASDLLCSLALGSASSSMLVRAVPAGRSALWSPSALPAIHSAAQTFKSSSQHDVCNIMFLSSLPKFEGETSDSATCLTISGEDGGMAEEIKSLNAAVESMKKMSGLPAKKISEEVLAIRKRIDNVQSISSAFRENAQPILGMVWKESLMSMRPEIEALVTRLQNVLNANFQADARIGAAQATSGFRVLDAGESDQATSLLMQHLTSTESKGPDFWFLITALFVSTKMAHIPLSAITLRMDNHGLEETKSGEWSQVFSGNAPNDRFGIVVNIVDSMGTQALQAVLMMFDRSGNAHVSAFVTNPGSAVLVPPQLVDVFIAQNAPGFRLLPRESPVIDCGATPNSEQIAPLAMFDKRLRGEFGTEVQVTCEDVSVLASFLQDSGLADSDVQGRVRQAQNQLGALSALVRECHSHPEKAMCLTGSSNIATLEASEKQFAVGKYAEVLAVMRSVQTTQDEIHSMKHPPKELVSHVDPIDGILTPFAQLQ